MGGQGRKTIIPLFSPKRYRERCGLPKPLPLGATATTAASGGNREELLGPRPAGCERQRSRRWEPQPGQWHCEAMTERASPARKRRRRSDGQALCQSDTIAVPVILGQQPSPLSLVALLLASSPKGGAIGMSASFRLDERSTISRKQQCSAVWASDSLTRSVVQKPLSP